MGCVRSSRFAAEWVACGRLVRLHMFRVVAPRDGRWCAARAAPLPENLRTRMTKKYRPRHAAPSKAGRIAGRAAVGAIGAPLALFAAAGPAGAAPLADDGADSAGQFAPPAFDAAELSNLLRAPKVPDVPGPATVTDLLAQLGNSNPAPSKLSPAALERVADS